MAKIEERVKIVVDPAKIGEKPVLFTLKTKGKREYVSAFLDKGSGTIYVDKPVSKALEKKILEISISGFYFLDSLRKGKSQVFLLGFSCI